MIDKKLSLVLPNHNEAGNIEAVVGRCLTVLPQVVPCFEVIVVDDGSVDGTGAIADELATKHQCVKVVHHLENQGYGAALRSGFDVSDGDIVMFMDSDRQFDISDISALLPFVDHYDIVAGYRIKRRDPTYRKVYAWLFELTVWILFGFKVRDIDCAFKIYDGELVRSLNLSMPGALINTEMLALAKRQHASIVQVGVHHYSRSAGEQSGGSPRVVFRAMGETIRLWWRLRNMEPVEELDPQQETEETEFGDSLNITKMAVAVGAFILALAVFFGVKKFRSGDE